MAAVQITESELVVRLTTGEKVGGLLRDLRVPRSAVRAVSVEEDAFGAVRGMRAPGLGVPGVRLIGTWRGRGHKAYVSVKRGAPALRVELEPGAGYDEIVVSSRDAERLAAALRA